MTSSRRIDFSRAYIVIAALLIGSIVGASQSSRAIDITDSRPLAGAIDALEAIVHVPINYEDLPNQNVADLQDVSTPQQRVAQPGFLLLVPRVGRVTAPIQEPSGATAAANDVLFDLSLLLGDYRQRSLPGDFKTEQANGMIYVTPAKVLGQSGSTLDVTSPMTAIVTIPDANRSVAEAAQAILDAVYKSTGQRIVIGTFPFWPNEKLNFSASGERARDAVSPPIRAIGKGCLFISTAVQSQARPNADMRLHAERQGGRLHQPYGATGPGPN